MISIDKIDNFILVKVAEQLRKIIELSDHFILKWKSAGETDVVRGIIESWLTLMLPIWLTKTRLLSMAFKEETYLTSEWIC